MDIADEIYPGGFFALLKRFETKRTPFRSAQDVLLSPDDPLAPLKTMRPPPHPSQMDKPFGHRSLEECVNALLHEFESSNVLHFYHAFCIANLRRDGCPDEARALFFRIWREEGRWLSETLSVRWLISAATTFADHGQTGDQRALGMGLSVLFDLIKLHDTERSMSGQPNDAPFPKIAMTDRPALAFDLHPYSLKNGDLDRNMLSRLWALAENEPLMFPLARRMLGLVMTDKRTIFARVQRLKNSG
ncbi:MAG: hypothetical protein AAGL89_10135 [Pseudomonadota bacterium]